MARKSAGDPAPDWRNMIRTALLPVALLTLIISACGNEEEEPYVWDDGARFFIGSSAYSDTALAWSPLGNVLLYTSYSDGSPNLFGYDRVTEPVKIASTSYDECVGPNGCWTNATDPGLIVYAAIIGDSISEIRTRTGDLGTISVLLNDSVKHIHPSWSPDAEQIVLSSKMRFVPDDSWNLYIADYEEGDTLAPQLLLQSSSRDLLRPSFSSDGSLILFQSSDGSQSDIWVMNSDGSDPRVVVEGSADDIHPCWSPYDGWFVFSSDRDGDYEVYAASLDSDTLIRITDDPAQDIYPAWNPTIPDLVFSADRTSSNYDIYYIEEPELPR